ncbi:hypothetical protein [Geopseudomonas aromaticivorans]
MKQQKIPVFLAALFLLIEAASASDRRDGNWWLQLDEVSKIFYVVGLIDGSELGKKLSTYGCFDDQEDFSSKEAECLSPILSSYNKHVERFIAGKPNKQFLDGLNSFYADYRNRNILTHDAILVVFRSIIGDPGVETLTNNLRKYGHLE